MVFDSNRLDRNPLCGAAGVHNIGGQEKNRYRENRMFHSGVLKERQGNRDASYDAIGSQMQGPLAPGL